MTVAAANIEGSGLFTIDTVTGDDTVPANAEMSFPHGGALHLPN